MAKASKAPAFQFYAGDFLSDANVQLMSLEERGAYITLLAHEWLEQGLPTDDESLAILSGARERWVSIKGRVIGCFKRTGNRRSKYVNPRLESERKKQADIRAKREHSGAEGNKVRWGKKLEEKGEIANAIDLRKVCDKKNIANDRSSISSSISLTTTPYPLTESAAAAEVIWEQPTNPPHPPERLSKLAKSAKIELSEIFPAAGAMTIPQIAHLIAAVQEKKAGKKIAKPVAVALHRERNEPPPPDILKTVRRHLDPAPPKKSPCPDCGQIIEDGYCNAGPWMKCPGCGRKWEP